MMKKKTKMKKESYGYRRLVLIPYDSRSASNPTYRDYCTFVADSDQNGIGYQKMESLEYGMHHERTDKLNEYSGESIKFMGMTKIGLTFNQLSALYRSD